MTEAPTPIYCANHPQVETSLRCNRCGKPICPKCAVSTPTGYRCRECVRGQQKVFETAEWYDYPLAVVIAGGVALRAWHLKHGVPYGVGADEPAIIERVLRMMRSGDYSPHFFDYPTLYIYLQLLVGIVRFMWGAIAGEWRWLTGITPEAFYLWGRSLTVLFGVATVALV